MEVMRLKDLAKFHLKDFKYPLETSARTAMYFLPKISAQAFLGRSQDPAFKKFKESFSLRKYFLELKKVYEQDAQNIKNNFYLAPQHIVPNLKEYGVLSLKNTLDMFKVRERILRKDTTIKTDHSVEDFPAYFKQSFHFQSGGYLSSESAELYDYQVELVFSGSAQAMRRHAIKAITQARDIKAYPAKDRLKILDVGCGTGVFTAELKRHFPMSDVTGLDLSPWYLKEAEKKFPDSGIEWKFGKAEELPFETGSQDIVTCVFLFHELPEAVRAKAMSELLRVLKPGGTLVQLDSLQKGDNAELDSSLEIFPHLYHEPYYENYISQSSEKEFSNLGLKDVNTDTAFYSKIVWGKKDDGPRSNG
jgi:ubiquinone/menaquinone biosynthesis C-methylase UbiE